MNKEIETAYLRSIFGDKLNRPVDLNKDKIVVPGDIIEADIIELEEDIHYDLMQHGSEIGRVDIMPFETISQMGEEDSGFAMNIVPHGAWGFEW